VAFAKGIAGRDLGGFGAGPVAFDGSEPLATAAHMPFARVLALADLPTWDELSR